MNSLLSPEKSVGGGGGSASPATPSRPPDFVTDSSLYKEFLAEREEILRHKWLESEKVGFDVGFEKALLDWIVKHRSSWREKRKAAGQSAPAPVPAETAADK